MTPKVAKVRSEKRPTAIAQTGHEETIRFQGIAEAFDGEKQRPLHSFSQRFTSAAHSSLFDWMEDNSSLVIDGCSDGDGLTK